MALKIKVSARSAAPSVPGSSVPGSSVPGSSVPGSSVPGSSVPDRFRPIYAAVSAPDPFVPVPVPCSAADSVTVRPWFSDFIVQVAVPGFSRPFYVSKYYRGRYSLTRDPLYAKTWSSPVLALQHAARVREKLIDYPYSFG